MSELYLFPRLPRPAARECLRSYEGIGLDELRDRSRTDHPAAAPAPTGGTPVPEEKLRSLQRAMRKTFADEWPDPLPRAGVASVDRRVGVVLAENLPIIPPDAAHEDVWSFLSVVLLPDIAAWRFSDRADDRMLGTARNVFRRPYERRRVLGELHDRPGVDGRPLGEDELVNIFERSRMARSHGLAKAMARHILSVDIGPRSEWVRELSKHVKRLLAYVNVDVLSDDELLALVREASDRVTLDDPA